MCPDRAVIALCLAAILSPVAGLAAKAAPPNLMFWSWFEQDDFRPLAGHGVGVAYLALSLDLKGQSEVVPRPRGIPVLIPPGAYQMAVIRIENSQLEDRPPALSQRQRELLVRMILEIATLAKPQAIQIDYDAPRSAWPFYRQLLGELRASLSPEVFLSITALVSWCDSEQSWLSGLPVDEMVPMAFYMGQSTPATVTLLARGGQFAFPGCRGSLGVEMRADLPEFEVRPRAGQRAYFFAGSRPWSPAMESLARKAILP